MRVDGRCHCGAISFEAVVEPGTIIVCHCTDCQTMTGSAYRATIFTRAETFVLKGEPKIYLKTPTRALAFCSTCGTPIYSTASENPTLYSLRLGTITQRSELGSPRGQGWCVSALPWSDDLRAVPRRDRQ